MKRILLTTFPDAFLNQGGGEREIHLLNEALNASGIIAEIYGPSSKPLINYDAVIHLSMNGGSEFIVNAVANTNIPLILWPNLWFVETPSSENLSRLNEIMHCFSAIVFRSRTEELHLKKYLNVNNQDVIRISPLISSKFFRKNITNVFRESYGLKKYAIWTGIIEPQKNQLAAVRAFKKLELDLIISGGIRDKDYADECKRAAGPNVKFISAMPFGSEQHLSALAHSEMFIELPLDFAGTSALEAASVGSKLLLSRSDWTSEMFGSSCYQANPLDEEEIRNAVIEILKDKESKTTLLNKKQLSMADAIIPLVDYLQTI